MTLPSGIPVDDLDPGIRPQDDLVRYANGGWLARTQIPADRARYDSFRILAEEAEQAVRAIVEEAVSAPEGSGDRKFGDLYASFMDAERAERLGWSSSARCSRQPAPSVPYRTCWRRLVRSSGSGSGAYLGSTSTPTRVTRSAMWSSSSRGSLAAGRELLP